MEEPEKILRNTWCFVLEHEGHVGVGRRAFQVKGPAGPVWREAGGFESTSSEASEDSGAWGCNMRRGRRRLGWIVGCRVWVGCSRHDRLLAVFIRLLT